MGASDAVPPAAAMSALMAEIREQSKASERRADLVLRLVREALARGIVQPGSRLPTEFEIAAALGISRTPVREAMRALETIGLVEIRKRAGTVIREGVASAFSELLLFESHLRGASLDRLTEVRRIFERTCAELAAERATAEDLARMREAIDRLDRLAASPDPGVDDMVEADTAFHRAVYRATHNPLIESLASFTLTMVSPWIRESLARTGASESVSLHRSEYALIARRNCNEIRGSSISAEADRGINHWLRSLE